MCMLWACQRIERNEYRCYSETYRMSHFLPDCKTMKLVLRRSGISDISFLFIIVDLAKDPKIAKEVPVAVCTESCTYLWQAQYLERFCWRVSTLPQKCVRRSVPQDSIAKMNHKSVPQKLSCKERCKRMSHISVPPKCLAKGSYKSIPQEWPALISYKKVW